MKPKRHKEKNYMGERCALCGCQLHRDGVYATPDVKGRSHATKHHYVPKRFIDRPNKKSGVGRKGVFAELPWEISHKTNVYCYDCHEQILHNPVLLPEDISNMADIIRKKGLNEDYKNDDMTKLRKRIELFHEIIEKGLDSVKKDLNREAD